MIKTIIWYDLPPELTPPRTVLMTWRGHAAGEKPPDRIARSIVEPGGPGDLQLQRGGEGLLSRPGYRYRGGGHFRRRSGLREEDDFVCDSPDELI